MLSFPLPAFVAKKTDKVLRDFLCQGNRNKKSFNLINWIYSIKGKKDGGLVVRGLKMHKVILLKNDYGSSQMRKFVENFIKTK